MNDDRPALAFSIEYRKDGDATLTVAGPAQAIREAAAAVFPDLAAALNTRCPKCVRQQFTPFQPG